MAWNNIKLIAYDLDGTVLVDEVIPPEVRDLMGKFSARRRRLCLASGRLYSDVLGILARSGFAGHRALPHHVMACDKLIYNLADGEYHELLSWNLSIRKRWERVLPRVQSRMPAIERELEKAGLAFRWLGDADFHRDIGAVPLRFESLAMAERAMEALRRAADFLPGTFINRNGSTLAITLADASKGHALTRLTQELGVDPAFVLAVGDSYNDLAMLDGRFGFQSACPANAEEIVVTAVRQNGGYLARGEVAEGFCEIMWHALET